MRARLLPFALLACCLASTSGRADPPAAPDSVPLVVQPMATPNGEWPVTVGVPFPDGALRDGDNVRLLDPSGREVPCQVRVTARWAPDGFVKWLLLDFLSQVDAERLTTYQLEHGASVNRAPVDSTLTVENTPTGLTVTTGPLRFDLRNDAFTFLDRAWLDTNRDGLFGDTEQVVAAVEGAGAYMVDQDGTRYESGLASPDELVVEESGPRRVVIRASGWHASADGERLGQYVTRIHAYAGQPFLRVSHTFIITADSREVRYRDIALATALASPAAGIVGTDGEASAEGGDGLSLVQDAWDHFFVSGAETRVEGSHAPGWIRATTSRGALTVSVRDFWQNYPKELELAGDQLIAHFWPGRNTPRRHALADTDASNVHMLSFAHEGQELDFSIPADYPTKFNRENASEFYYIPGATENANAIGVAKTHEMLYHFHATDADTEDVAGAADAFQKGVACWADPEWVCATEAFGSMPMQPRDPEQFPQAEWALSAMFDCERRLGEYTRDYGMWVFGSGHNEWAMEEKRWRVNRTWRNTHHGSPRLAWLLYARSGDPKYLDHARRNTRHCMDLAFCHYSTPEFEGLEYPRQKIKGALTDYKGLVPWHSGGRLFDYNSMADFMLYNYYVTGDRRGLDVVQQWTEAAVERFRKGRDHREGAGVLATLVAAYQHGWDDRLLPLIEAHAEAMFASQYDDGSIEQWPQYAPWLGRLHKLTGSPESEECLRRWCDWYATRLKSATDYGHAHLWPVAYGYHVFGREEYLAAVAGHVQIALDSVYRDPGGFYDGYWTRGPSTDMGYLSQDLPFYLYAVAQHGEPVRPTYYGRQIMELAAGAFRIVALDEDDRAFTVTWQGRTREEPTRYALTGPDGATIQEGVLEPETGPEKELVIEVPADGKRGEYALALEVGEYLSLQIPMTDLPREVLDTMHQQVIFVREPRACFMVPADCERAELALRQYLDPNVVCVYDRDGNLAGRRQWVGTEEAAVTMELTPEPEQRGQTWAIHFGDKTKRSLLTLDSTLPPYVSVDHDRFFLPRG